MDDVAVGQHQAIRADDEAGAAAARLAPVAPFSDLLARLDLHDRGADFFRRMHHRLRIGIQQLKIRRSVRRNYALAFEVWTLMGDRLEGGEILLSFKTNLTHLERCTKQG